MTGPIPFDDRYDEPEQLREQLRLLLRHRVAMALGVALGLLGGLAAAWYCAGTYSSASDVLVRAGADPFGSVSVPADNQVSMGTEQQIAAGATVAVRAAHTLGQPDSRATALQKHLRVTNPGKSQVLRFEFTANTPRRAARGANAFAEAYLADRESRGHAAVQRAVAGMKQQITALSRQAKKEADDDSGTSPAKSEINSLHKRVSEISSRDTDGGDIVRRAAAPARPSGPGVRTLVVLGLAGGVVLGIMLAWLCSALDRRVRSAREVQAALRAPVLGVLPHERRSGGNALTVGRTRGARAQAFRSVAYRLARTGLSGGGGCLLVVAPRRRDAAGTVAANLAAAFAECGRQAVLVDADPDAPSLAARLPLVPDAERAGQETPLPEGGVLVDAGSAGRFALCSGDGTGVPARAGGSGTTEQVASGAGSPVTVVAAGPLLENPNALAAADGFGGVLVVTGRDTRRQDLRQVSELIGCSGGRLLGAVVDSGRTRRGLGAAVLRRVKPRSRAEGVLPATQRAGQHDTLTVTRG
ncbi:YveK family protein [Streptomyces sp. NPDC001135]